MKETIVSNILNSRRIHCIFETPGRKYISLSCTVSRKKTVWSLQALPVVAITSLDNLNAYC